MASTQNTVYQHIPRALTIACPSGMGPMMWLSYREVENSQAIGPSQWKIPEGWCNKALIRWAVASKKMCHSGLICILSAQRNIMFLSYIFSDFYLV